MYPSSSIPEKAFTNIPSVTKVTHNIGVPMWSSSHGQNAPLIP